MEFLHHALNTPLNVVWHCHPFYLPCSRVGLLSLVNIFLFSGLDLFICAGSDPFFKFRSYNLPPLLPFFLSRGGHLADFFMDLRVALGVWRT